ncbi:MAG: ABC transporter permease subunit [Syntrophobacteraceae bacterium]|jgi:ABC-2 type transport system permease protein|nr:ABC transporter permease subunit [Syntrophobacteraceae bacterium]
MKGFGAIYRKELYSLFASPIFYVVAGVFLIITGYFFYNLVAYYGIVSFQASQNPMAMKQLNVTNMVVSPFFGDVSIVLLLISPLLTMRLYAEERKSGTIELLFTYPVSDLTTLLAKFAGVFSAFLVILAGTLPGMILLGYVGDPNWKALLCGYLGTALLGGAFLALGLFTSALTQNQIVAAVLAFGALLMFWIIGWVKNLVGEGMGRFVEYISVTRHFESFTKGVLDSRDLIYYLLFIVLFLFFTLRQMESYRWRG